jgi:hypothetical protein
MTKAEKLHTAQDFIAWELQKTAKTKTITLIWSCGRIDPTGEIYRLAIFTDAKRTNFTFTKDELTKWYGSKKWEIKFLRRVREILAEMGERSPNTPDR